MRCAQSTGTKLTFDGPKKEVEQGVTSSSGSVNLYVTENGSYTVTLTDTYGNVISKTIEVKKIDRKKPTVTLRSGSSTGADTVYNELIIAVLPEDTGGSGVAKVEYAWTNTTGTPSTSAWTHTDCGCRWQLSGTIYRSRDIKDRKVPACKGDRRSWKCIGNREVGTLSSDKEGSGSSPSFHYGNGKSVFVDKKCQHLHGKRHREAAQVQEHLRLSIHRRVQ